MKQFAFILILLVFGPLEGQPTIGEELDQHLEIQVGNLGFQGVVRIRRGDSLVYEKAMGMASIQHGVPNRMDFPPNLGSTRLRQLLNHSSGIPHNEAIPGYWRVKSKLHFSPGETLEEIKRNNENGNRFQYSSIGHLISARILEGSYKKPIIGISFPQIFEPIGLGHTGLYDPQRIIPNMALGYQRLPEGSLVATPYRDFSLLKGARDCYSTAEDLGKWCQWLMDKAYIGGARCHAFI